jgi:hypothetical protein
VHGTRGITWTPSVYRISTQSHSYGYGYYLGASIPYPGYPMPKTVSGSYFNFFDENQRRTARKRGRRGKPQFEFLSRDMASPHPCWSSTRKLHFASTILSNFHSLSKPQNSAADPTNCPTDQNQISGPSWIAEPEMPPRHPKTEPPTELVIPKALLDAI